MIVKPDYVEVQMREKLTTLCQLQRVRASVHQSNTRSLALMGQLGLTGRGVTIEVEEYRGENVSLVLFELGRPS